jgi:hypothetical protein
MRITTTLLSSALLLNTLSAQNYKTVYSNNTSHFSYSNYWNPVKTFYNTIHIDSTATVAGSEELYNFINFQDSLSWSCYPANRNAWIASKIIQSTTGEEYFFTPAGDTVYLLPQASLNNTWHLYNYSNGNYIEAKVVSIAMQSFIGLNDSVKTIEMTAKDAGGNTIANILNGKQLKLSENYGFIQTLGFRYFPSDTVLFHLSGIDNISAGITNLTAAQIFDFNVGDEFHYRKEYHFDAAHSYFHYSIYKVLSKSFSGDSSTVFYTSDVCQRSVSYSFSDSTVNTGQGPVNTSFILSPSFINKYSFQMKDTSAAGWQSSTTDNGFLNFFIDTTYLGRIKKETHYYYSPDWILPCFSMLVGECVFPDTTYAPGLGWVSISDQTCGGGNMIYYKKGAEEWGTQLNCSVLLSAGAVSNDKSSFEIYPNPAPFYSEITFNYPSSALKRELIIHSVIGNEIVRYSLSSGSTSLLVKLPSLAAGLYIARVSGSGTERIVKFVVQ